MSFDLVIRGGQVVDGTGRAPQAADVAIRDGEIAERRSGFRRGSPRRYQTSTDDRAVLCNGVATLRDDLPTGASPGRML